MIFQTWRFFFHSAQKSLTLYSEIYIYIYIYIFIFHIIYFQSNRIYTSLHLNIRLSGEQIKCAFILWQFKSVVFNYMQQHEITKFKCYNSFPECDNLVCVTEFIDDSVSIFLCTDWLGFSQYLRRENVILFVLLLPQFLQRIHRQLVVLA